MSPCGRWLGAGTPVLVALVGVSMAAAAGLTVVDDTTPAVAPAGERIAVELALRNDGPEPWTPAAGYAVSYHLRSAAGDVVQPDGPRTPLPREVVVGDTVSVAARLETPADPGRYLVEWDVVEEHVRWVSSSDETRFSGSPLEVRPRHAAHIEVASPRWMRSGATATVAMEVENRGAIRWPDDGSIAVSFHWFAPDGTVLVWDGRRTPLRQPVPPGGTATVEAVVEAPADTGSLLLEWDLVHEGVTWFCQETPESTSSDLVMVVAPPPLAVVAGLVGSIAALALAVRDRRRRRSTNADLVWLGVAAVAVPWWVTAAAAESLELSGAWLTVTVGALVVGVCGLLPRRWRPWASWAVGTAVIAVAVGDVIHLRFFGDLPSLASLGAAGQLDEITASVVSLLGPGDWWLGGVVSSGGLVALLSPRRGAGPQDAAAVRTRSALLVVVAVVASALAIGFGTRPDHLEQVFRNLYVAKDIGVLPYHAVDAARVLADRFHRDDLDDDELAEILEWFRATAPRRAGTGPAFGAAAGTNLVMIQVESLQTFAVSYEVGGVPVMPTLARWRDEAVSFAAVTDQTAAGRSSDAELATQASLLPPDRGPAVFRFPGNDFTGIASVLAERGYQTLSAVPFDGGFWNRRITHRAWGYQKSLFADQFEPGPVVGWGLNDRDLLLQVADRLADEPQPFCAWVLTLSLHHPFEGFPDELEELDVGVHEGTPFGAYLHTIHLFDSSLAAFVDRLSELGLADRTTIVLWGDHDAGFEWTASFAARLGRPHDAAGWYLSQSVPLFVRLPAAAGLAGRRNDPAGHVDVAPTVLALLGVDPADYAFVGRNLLGDPGDEPVIGEYRCWRDRTRLFLQGGPDLEDGKCLDVETLGVLPAAECADRHRAAMTRVRISDRVLAHDLQRSLHRALRSGGRPGDALDDASAATLR